MNGKFLEFGRFPFVWQSKHLVQKISLHLAWLLVSWGLDAEKVLKQLLIVTVIEPRTAFVLLDHKYMRRLSFLSVKQHIQRIQLNLISCVREIGLLLGLKFRKSGSSSVF